MGGISSTQDEILVKKDVMSVITVLLQVGIGVGVVIVVVEEDEEEESSEASVNVLDERFGISNPLIASADSCINCKSS